MEYERDLSKFNRFLMFGPPWTKKTKSTMVKALRHWIDHEIGSQFTEKNLDAEARLLFDLVSRRRYPDIIAGTAELSERFITEILNSFTAIAIDARENDPSRDFDSEFLSKLDGDIAILRSTLQRVSDLGVDDHRIAYYLDALQNNNIMDNYEKIDRKTLISKAQEDLQEILDSFRNEFNRRFIMERFDSYLAQLDGKFHAIEALRARLSVFGKMLGRFWDLPPGTWEVSAWNSLAKYAELLDINPGVLELLESLGRYVDAENELRLETISSSATKAKWSPSGIGKSEIAGIRFSDDISAMLPSETALLSFPETELLFLKKFSEKSLLTLEYLGEERFDHPEPRTVLDEKPSDKRGPFVICIDTSGSMHGTPETIAKTIAFVVLRKALNEDRSCLLVSFSTEIKICELTNARKGMKELIEFLQMSFHGGTDATPALRYTIDRISAKQWNRADVLLISDFVMPRPDTETCDKIQTSRDSGTRFNALVIGKNAHDTLGELFDHVWKYDPNQGVYRDLAKIISS